MLVFNKPSRYSIRELCNLNGCQEIKEKKNLFVHFLINAPQNHDGLRYVAAITFVCFETSSDETTVASNDNLAIYYLQFQIKEVNLIVLKKQL